MKDIWLRLQKKTEKIGKQKKKDLNWHIFNHKVFALGINKQLSL